jgi:hypothetical protein
MQGLCSLKWRNVVYVLTIVFLSAAHQMTYAQNVDTNDSSWFVGIGAGIYKNHFSASNTSVPNGVTSLTPYNQDIYSINNSSSNNVDLLGGYRWHTKNSYLPYQSLYGLYRHYSNSTINGNVELFGLPEFINYKYKMIYNADLFALNYKINLFELKNFLPYVSLGAGYIINHVNDYSETPTSNVTPRISPDYQGKTTHNPVGIVGVGIDYVLSKNYWLTLGCERVYQNSSINSSSGTSSWSSTALRFNTLQSDIVFLHFTANVPDGFRI